MLVCGEPSGDQLGAQLMAGLKQSSGGDVEITGVGGPAMAAQGLKSLFPLDDDGGDGSARGRAAHPRDPAPRARGERLRARRRGPMPWC